MQSRKISSQLYYCILFCVILTGVLFGYTSSQAETENLSIRAGISYFNNPAFGSKVNVEFPFTLNRNEFEPYQPDADSQTYELKVFAQLDLIDDSGYPIDSAQTYFTARVMDLDEAAKPGYKLFNNLQLLIDPGLYTARLTVTDVVSKREGSVFYDSVMAVTIPEGKLTLGGMNLAYSITYVGDNPGANRRMVKNGLQVLTNPLGLYSTEDTVLYLYAELYNLDFDPKNPSQYKMAYTIEDENGVTYRDFGFKMSEKAGKSMVISEALDIADLVPGSFFLRLTASDESTGAIDIKRVPLVLVSPENIRQWARARELSDPYAAMTLKDKMNLVAYRLSSDQKAILKGLTPEGQENYLDRYWAENDEDPTTEINETRIELIARYDFANDFFSSDRDHTNGWKSDRGRIYIQWGPPEKVDDRPMPIIATPEAETMKFINPFVVWWYFSVEEGKVFVFEDKEGYDADLSLVHSNVEGEIFNGEWDNALREQYLELY